MNIRSVPATDLSAEQLTAWDRLQQQDPAAAYPFFRPEFIQVAARECTGVEVAVLEQAGECVGFFPYQRDRQGVARAVAWQMSDMHGIVLRPGVRVDAKTLLQRVGLKAWHFDHVPVGQETFRSSTRSVDDAYFMDLSRGYDDYLDRRRREGASLISQASRKSRKLAREVGSLRFEFHDTSDSAADALVSWKSAQLRRQGAVDTFRLPWVAPLLRRAARHQSANFAGVLSTLYAGDTLVAVHLGVSSGPEFCSWVPAYNADFAKYSPGVILQLEIAKAAQSEGIQRIDLGRGANRMKLSLKSGSTPLAIGSVERRLLRGVGTAAWYGLRSLAHSSPLGRGPLRIYRRLRGALAGGWRTAPVATPDSELPRT